MQKRLSSLLLYAISLSFSLNGLAQNNPDPDTAGPEYKVRQHMGRFFAEFFNDAISTLNSPLITSEGLDPTQALAVNDNECEIQLDRRLDGDNANYIVCELTYENGKIAFFKIDLSGDSVELQIERFQDRKGSLRFAGPGGKLLTQILSSFSDDPRVKNIDGQWVLQSPDARHSTLDCQSYENLHECSYTLPETKFEKANFSLGENTLALFYGLFLRDKEKLANEEKLLKTSDFKKVRCSFEGIIPESSYPGLLHEKAKIICTYELENVEGEKVKEFPLNNELLFAWGNRFGPPAVAIGGSDAERIFEALKGSIEEFNPGVKREEVTGPVTHSITDMGSFYYREDVSLFKIKSREAKDPRISVNCYFNTFETRHEKEFRGKLPKRTDPKYCVFFSN